MQQLTIVRIHDRFELYCQTCDTAFDKDLFLDNIDHFLDIHRVIHKRLDLDMPDFDDNPQSYTQVYTQNITSYPQINITDNENLSQ